VEDRQPIATGPVKPTKQGRYATADEAAMVKNKPLVALLKKLTAKANPQHPTAPDGL
jgi:hypothetical protein